jgi:macrophage erythroblast attacher
VPYEQLRKGFRTTQRNFERDFGQLATAVAEMSSATIRDEDEESRMASLAFIDGTISRIETLKAKVCVVYIIRPPRFNSISYISQLADVQQSMVTTQISLRARIDHLVRFESTASEHTAWAEKRMDRWLVDVMLRASRFQSAIALALAKDIEVCLTRSAYGDRLSIQSHQAPCR